MSTIHDNGTMARGRRWLTRNDPTLAPWIRKIGAIELSRGNRSYFARLCRSIIGQQLSARAAETVCGRVFALFEGPRGPRPEEMLTVPHDDLRGAGLSRQKIGYLRALAEAFHDGHLHGYRFSRHDDDRIAEDLVRVKGLGPWTVEMFMLFALGRPDIYSEGDLALRHGLDRIEGRSFTPSQCGDLATRWEPWRSVASLYLWRIAHWPKEDSP